jgi:hypothetical protein
MKDWFDLLKAKKIDLISAKEISQSQNISKEDGISPFIYTAHLHLFDQWKASIPHLKDKETQFSLSVIWAIRSCTTEKSDFTKLISILKENSNLDNWTQVDSSGFGAIHYAVETCSDDFCFKLFNFSIDHKLKTD